MFKLDIASLCDYQKTLAKQREFHDVNKLPHVRVNCDNAVRRLITNDFVGEAQIAFLEAFNDWINSFDLIMIYLEELEKVAITALADANKIQKKCDDLPTVVGGAKTTTAEDTGVIFLADDFGIVKTKIQYMLDNEISSIKTNLTNSDNKLHSVSGASEIQSKISDTQTAVRNFKSTLLALGTDFITIAKKINRFEETVISSSESLLNDMPEIEAKAAAMAAHAFGFDEGTLIETGIGTGIDLASLGLERAGKGKLPRLAALFGGANSKSLGYATKGVDIIGILYSVYDTFTYTAEAMETNPYLPEQWKHNRMPGAFEVGAFKNTATSLAGKVGGAGGAIVAGFLMDSVDSLGYVINDRPLSESYINWRMHHEATTFNPGRGVLIPQIMDRDAQLQPGNDYG
ncbi:MAG: hypothetical protein LBG97_00675 [Coriobacteriales bacterium]|jgi:hypothetical protein|nr:hypothetical protein [Coriobacteriales bacterium]